MLAPSRDPAWRGGTKILGRAQLDSPAVGDDLRDIEQSLAGDHRAYEQLVRRYEAGVASWLWRFTRERVVLEELVQEVFVQAYFSLGSYKSRAQFRTWLLSIATRVGYAHWRKTARERERATATAERVKLVRGEVVDPSPSEAAEALHLVFKQLPCKDRLVLTLMYFEELDTKEIADITGWSRSLVKVRAYRARQKLKNLLEETGLARGENG